MRTAGHWRSLPFLDGEAACAWVAPVERAGGGEAVLKIALPHMEGAHEIGGALFLERCLPGTSHRALPEPEQDAVLAELLPLLQHLFNCPARMRTAPLATIGNFADRLGVAAEWARLTLRG